LRLSFTVPAHTRVTRDVDADLGSRVSAAAVLTATQPVVAERLVRHGTDIAVDSGTPSPGSHWYFAAGNTSHGYREYLAVENPGTRAVQVSFLFMPAHGHPFTLIKSVGASSRLTVKVNLYVPNDAVAVQVSAPRPVAVNRTLFIRSGMSSKTGVAAPARSWYFASGPRRDHAVNWISVSNPGATPAVVTLRAYGVHGALLASVTRSIEPYLPVSFSMNRIAQHADVSVVVTSSVPVVAEQSTYLGPAHQATTAAFGMTVPTRAVQFAAMGARGSLGESDTLDVFNPSNSPAALVLRLITSSGTATQQTYLVGPRGREAIDVESVAGDTQLGASLVSSVPVVVVNRYSTDRGIGGDTSTGVQPPA
jgi:hypothetical protein